MTLDQVKALRYSSDGTPWANIVTGSHDVNTLQYSEDGTPWYGFYTIIPPSGNLLLWNGVPIADLDTIIETPVASVATINSIAI